MENTNIKITEDKKTKTPVVAITQGDTNSIGYEIIVKALKDNRIFEFFTPIIYGNSKTASYHRKTIAIENFNFNLIKNTGVANSKRVNIININDDEIKIELGKETEISGKQAYLSLETAVEDIKKINADILVTTPISKKAIQTINQNFIGHTEYLQEKFEVKDTLMIMASKLMKIALATTHTSIASVSSLIKKDMLINKIYLFNQSLIQDFNITKPKIAILALNPHASDNGMFGDEEKNEICPAIDDLSSQGVLAYGPFPADGFFGNIKNLKEYDGVFAMYHDQALIPFKTLCFEDGVNFTAGLPIVRTSPAHGTAFDIAGKDIASGLPMRNALLLACEIHKNRINYAKRHENPLDNNIINS